MGEKEGTPRRCVASCARYTRLTNPLQVQALMVKECLREKETPRVKLKRKKTAEESWSRQLSLVGKIKSYVEPATAGFHDRGGVRHWPHREENSNNKHTHSLRGIPLGSVCRQAYIPVGGCMCATPKKLILDLKL